MAPSEPTATGAPRRRFSIGGPITRAEWLGIAAVAAIYLVVVLLSVRRGPPLGWDEAVYALRARDFVDGVDPRRYWNDYRAPGLPWLGQFLWLAGRHVTVLRLLVAAFGLVLVLVAWLVARHLFGGRAGVVAAAGVALTPPLLLAATQVWPDVPGAALGLLAIGLFLFATGGERPSWWMLSVVPAVAAATYLRFGAPLPIAMGLVVVAVWRRRVLARGPAPMLATAAAATAVVVLILEVPQLTGVGGAPLTAIAGGAGRWFEGFGDYALVGHEVIGPAAVVLALVGVVAALAFAGSGGIDRGALLGSVIVGAATAGAIALLLHGEVRYLAPAYPWLWVAGAPGLVRLASALPPRARAATAAVVVIALAAAAVGTAQERNRDSSHGFSPLRRAAEAVGEERAGKPCLVVTGRIPQVMWYSGCDVRLFDLHEARLPSLEGGEVFMVFFEGDSREPGGELREQYLAAGDLWFSEEGYRDVLVYRVRGAGGG